MPDVVAGANRAQSAPEQVRYEGRAGQFGIEVSEVADLYPGVTANAQAFPKLAQLLGGGRAELRGAARVLPARHQRRPADRRVGARLVTAGLRGSGS
jgi:hypothetical protein